MRWTIVLLTLALAACSPLRKATPPSQPSQAVESPPPAQPAELLAQADSLAKSGNFGGAIALLSDASRHYPDAEDLQQALSRLRNIWESRRQELEDRLLIIWVEYLSKQLPLWERLFRGDPADRIIKGEIEHTRRQLGDAANPLTRCGEHQLRHNVILARRCLSLSLDIREDPRTRSLLAKLDSKQKNRRAKKNRRKQRKRSRGQRTLAASHLQKVLELTKEGEDQSGLKEVDAIVETSLVLLDTLPDSESESKKVIAQVTDQLLVVGDKLYRIGRIQSAIACWRAILALDPTREQIQHKLQRAQRVLENLNDLRNRDQHARPADRPPSASSPVPPGNPAGATPLPANQEEYLTKPRRNQAVGAGLPAN